LKFLSIHLPAIAAASRYAPFDPSRREATPNHPFFQDFSTVPSVFLRCPPSLAALPGVEIIPAVIRGADEIGYIDDSSPRSFDVPAAPGGSNQSTPDHPLTHAHEMTYSSDKIYMK
jgi:hypothetical protein